MLSKELKQLIKLSGGKVIVSEGSLKSSFVVMSLAEYLKEIEGKRGINGKSGKELAAQAGKSDGPELSARNEEAGQGLTNDELLDRINTDIAQLRNRNVEKEAVESFESEKENLEYNYESVH